MNVLMTGSSGFLGKRLCEVLEEKDFKVTKLTSKNCDLTHESSLDNYSETKYQYIFHLAAWTQAGDFCIKHPGEQWIYNQQINTNTLAWWHKQQRDAKLIFMGTSCVYAPDSELKESEYMLGEPIDSLYTYAMTKRMLYQGARALNQQFGMRYLCAVPSTLYGPGYHTDGRQMHFIFDLIRKIIRAKLYNEEVVLWGDGYQKRELVYIDDFIHILIKLNEKAENDVFNIGAGEEYTIRDFAKIICDIVDFDHNEIKYDESRYIGAKSKCLNTEKIRNVIEPYKMMRLEDGLRETVQWFYESKSYI